MIKKQINELIQLQMLSEARAQQEMTSSGARLEQLDDSIETMLRELPADVAESFTRLHKRGMVAIVPVAGGGCSGCGMSLPVSLVYAVRACEELHRCPNCARFLYPPDATAPRRLGARKRHMEPLKSGVARFSAQELMLPHAAAADRDTLIAAVCAQMEREGFVDNGARLAEVTLAREAVISTAVDNGLAFPHARGVEGGGLTLALATSPKGLRFTPDARRLTRIVFFVAIPTAASAFYLKLLAGLSKVFSEEKARDDLLRAATPKDLWKALTHLTAKTIE
jgi:mannitol/fructose-specific phosphotransferase system IIA component (Ntr-type)